MALEPTKASKICLILSFAVRVLQIVFCVVCLATAGHWAKTWAPYRLNTFQVYLILQSVNLAIFASVTGFLLSTFMLFAPRIAPKIAEDLPGLIDLIFSGVWSVFFLAAGASIISWGACKASALCLVWKCTTAISFLLWVLYAISAVLASLDLRAQLMALREPAVASSAAAIKNGSKANGKAANGKTVTDVTATAARTSRPTTPVVAEQV